MTENTTPLIFTPSEVANYVVCPEAWRIKTFGQSPVLNERPGSPRGTAETRKVRRDWVAQQDLRSQIRSYTKVVYLLLCLVTTVVFLLEQHRSSGAPSHLARWGFEPSFADETDILSRVIPIPTELLLLLLMLGVLIFIWDLLERTGKKISRQSGVPENSNIVAIKGSEFLPSEEYHSEALGLRGRADALVKDKRFLIPVLFIPKGKKIRDRHVAELLVLLRLVAEHSDAPLPYGIALLSATKRQVRVRNTAEKQRWLDTVLDEMRAIGSKQAPAVPAPAIYKCKNCDVRTFCKFSAYSDSK